MADQEDILLGISEVKVNESSGNDSIIDQEKDFAKDLDDYMEGTPAPQIVMPNFRRKKITTPEPSDVSNKKKGLNLSELLKNKVKTAVASKPIDLNTLEGQREMINKREREAKAVAKAECIEKMNHVEKHMYHWPVNKISF